MFQGLRTAIYHVPDVEQGKAWYSRALGIDPYFESPGYIGYEVGGYELGLQPDAPAPADPPTGTLVYWGVPSAADAYLHLIAIGAREHTPIQDVGDGIRLATVLDPFGNLLGIIENPHFSVKG